MDNASIKENIYRKRNEEGISQDEMARRLGIVRNTYRKIERGPVRLLSEHIDGIAEVLGTTPEELVLGYKPFDGSGMLDEIRMEYDSRRITGCSRSRGRLVTVSFFKGGQNGKSNSRTV